MASLALSKKNIMLCKHCMKEIFNNDLGYIIGYHQRGFIGFVPGIIAYHHSCFHAFIEQKMDENGLEFD